MIKTVFEQSFDVIRGRIETLATAGSNRLPAEPDLARELKVSRGTVRKVMARLERERVVDRRQGKGTFIRPRRAKLILRVLVSQRPSEMFAPAKSSILRGVCREIEDSDGVEIEFKPIVRAGMDEVDGWVGDVASLRADGYVVVAPLRRPVMNALMSASVPCVFVDVDYDDPRVPAVLIDHRESGRLAGRFFGDMGLRRLAFIGGMRGKDTVRQADGVLAGLAEVLPGAEIISEVTLDDGEAFAAAARLAALENGPEGFLVAGNTRAAGVQEALRTLDRGGRAAPVVLGIVDKGALAAPRIEVPCMEQMGREAARRALSLMNGQTLPETEVRFAPRLVMR